MSVADLLAAVAVLGGAVLSALAGLAVLRFPDTMTRIHAATKPQVLGVVLLMLGVGLALGRPAVLGVLVLVVVLQFVTAPVSAHLAVRAALRRARGTAASTPADSPTELATDLAERLADPGRGEGRR